MATTTKQRGLGKGLSALISEGADTPVSTQPQKSSAPATTGSGYTTLPIGKLTSGKYQPRTQFDEGTLTELAESIEKNGIMQPIVVRQLQGAETYEIVAGERRWRASKIAGLQNVPVIIREITDKQALELALVENIQRQDLKPLEEAAGYQRLIEEFDYLQEELATVVGKSRSHVANLLRLLGLPDEVKELLDKDELTMGHARALLNAPDPVTLAREIVKRGLNVRQAEAVSREIQGNKKRSSPRAGSPSRNYSNPNKDPDIIALEESLSENLGLQVSIDDRGQSGHITIAYENLSQLDVILRKLGADAEELV
ncbi:MAG: ParB/RepB/Spo0J family partition protein [Rickettsiales bacterium]